MQRNIPHMKIDLIRSVYFIGIGGIGMSALARYFKSKGAEVSGYDKTATTLTKQLVVEGISVMYTDDIALAPKSVDVVVYTPAIPATHEQLNFYRTTTIPVVKRSDVLQWITESSMNVCIGGTHGKTTITSLTAHLLRHTGYGCNAFLGGIATNYNTNFWSSENNCSVIEADEYDRSFLKLVPDVAVITAMDADHLDIYGTPEAVEEAYITFSKQVKQGGCLITKYGLSRANEFNQQVQHYTYHLNDTNANVYAANLTVNDGSYYFDIISKQWQLHQVVLHMGGLHNVENTIAAVMVAKHLGIDDEKIKAAVASFKGVKRRFEYYIKNQQHVMIDDYAHHPEELRALITGVRSLYHQKITIVFQPHLFSRTQDLATAFADALNLADEVILLPIYPARELPIPGVTSNTIATHIEHEKVKLLTKEEMLQYVASTKPVLLVMAGAGDIDTLLTPVQNILNA